MPMVKVPPGSEIISTPDLETTSRDEGASASETVGCFWHARDALMQAIEKASKPNSAVQTATPCDAE